MQDIFLKLLKKCLFLVSFVAGCSGDLQDIPLGASNISNEEFKVEIYRGGQIVRENKVAPGEAIHFAIVEWIKDHPHGWRKSYGNYVPEFVIRGDSFSIRKNGNLVILICKIRKNEFSQLERDLAEPFPDVVGMSNNW